jgi:hypothetical protein
MKVQFPDEAEILLHGVKTGSGAHPTTYPISARGGAMKLSTQFHLDMRLRICGAISPLPHTSL